jgi:hypothetical protein
MIALEDQARGYWVAARVLRRGDVPADVADNLAALGELTAGHVREYSAQTLCVLGSEATIPRLRRRIMREWPSLVPVAPEHTPPGAA